MITVKLYSAMMTLITSVSIRADYFTLLCRNGVIKEDHEKNPMIYWKDYVAFVEEAFV